MKKAMKIYLVEDDPTILSLLKSHLEKDYQVAAVSNFRDIKNEILDFEPDLILMDITLPFFNGFYWTSEIRKQSTVPIIFISSSNDEMDAVMALNMGGDDYITKPFSLTILDAKIAAFLRRATQFAIDSLSYKNYQLHFDSSLSNEVQKISLSPTEHKILSLLFSNQGAIVSKEELLKSLWDNDQFIDQNTLNVNMTRLRKKLLDIDFDYIHTVRGVGYILK
ncbi:response regulator transcription factor [Streptococcus uberis]|uniref:response regulator transcription factor n=1 Tax=Streptococcus uberis TaxID=1349 RepID=UPI001FF65F46|nr:response regulator transcription factor [Streptococcus uberis]MCK1188872.1 response regulator transcription factor [Streptococcus uberis]